MIAKHIPMRSLKKSSFKELAEYILNSQKKEERVGKIRVTNCIQPDPRDALLEVQAVQAINTRSKDDKTYHLLVSFRAGESMNADTLEAIETRICTALGFSEHQRMSAVHHDTDNLHIHIAINKIHPTRYTIHTPYKAYKAIAQICEKLEKEYGLQPDNHIPKKTLSENKAQDMEKHSGVESLIGWIQRRCVSEMLKAQSWSELHTVMVGNSLQIRERANGLVIENQDGIRVKASSIARPLSKAQLEKRLGPFQPFSSEDPFVETKTSYQKDPIFQKKINTIELYAAYKLERQNSLEVRQKSVLNSTNKKLQMITALKRNYKFKRSLIKMVKGPALSKKILYGLAYKSFQSNLKKIRKTHLQNRAVVSASHRPLTWADWLRVKAMEGNKEALAALRSRKKDFPKIENSFFTNGHHTLDLVSDVKQDSITKSGTIIYRVGLTTIRDSGKLLNISREIDKVGIEAVLQMAIQKYGKKLTIKGTTEFKKQVATVSAMKNLNLTFTDVDLDKLRQDLIMEFRKNNRKTQPLLTENNHEIRREKDSPSPAIIGRGGVGRIGDRRQVKPDISRSSGGRGRVAPKSNFRVIRRNPPPIYQNGLRRVSQCNLDQITRRGKILLSSDARLHLEHQGTDGIHPLRRGVPGGQVSLDSAADKYIAEREAKRAYIVEVQKHRRFDAEKDIGEAQFAGVRHVDNTSLALLRSKGEVVVLPINASTQQRLKGLSLGQAVALTSQGGLKIKGKGKSR